MRRKRIVFDKKKQSLYDKIANLGKSNRTNSVLLIA